jgi:hypothetical protein
MRLTVCLLAWFVPPAVHGDILHLRDGSRYYGTLLRQNENEIEFRIVLAEGASVVRRFPISRVKCVEHGAGERPGPVSLESDQLPQDLNDLDFEQMLREAYELVDDGDLPAALRALQRIVMHAPNEVLEQLDRHARAARGRPLDEFLAETRIRAALEPRASTHAAPRSSRLFDLKFATRFEAGALGRRLEQLHARLLSTAYQGRTIETWARRREEYTELRPDARRMVADARRAAAVLGVRLRFDPRLKNDRRERRRLAILRADLARFAAKVSAMPGFTSLGVDAGDEDDPTLRAAQRLAAEQAAASQPAASQPARE